MLFPLSEAPSSCLTGHRAVCPDLSQLPPYLPRDAPMIPGMAAKVCAAEFQLLFQLLVKLLRRRIKDVLLLGELQGEREDRNLNCIVPPANENSCHPSMTNSQGGCLQAQFAIAGHHLCLNEKGGGLDFVPKQTSQTTIILPLSPSFATAREWVGEWGSRQTPTCREPAILTLAQPLVLPPSSTVYFGHFL